MRTLKIVGVLMAALIAASILASLHRLREPRCGRLTLSQWLDERSRAEDALATNRCARMAASEYAVRQIGTNAIPRLLELLQSKDVNDPPLAWLGFGILGGIARPAVPALVALTRSPDALLRYRAFDCLMETDPDKETVLAAAVPLLRDKDRNVQFQAAEALLDYPDEAEKAGVFKLFPNAPRVAEPRE